MEKRLMLILLTSAAIGFFVLPETLSMFAGQHSWYDPKNDGIPCVKCHFLEAEEMRLLVGPHTNETGEGRMECTYCHRGFEIGTSKHANNDEIDPRLYSYTDNSSHVHAAQTLSCLYCHSGADKGYVIGHSQPAPGPSQGRQDCLGKKCHIDDDPPLHLDPENGLPRFDNEDCLKCHGDPPKYITPAKGFNLTMNTSDTGEGSAHIWFVLDSMDMTMLEDANEACIGCHTQTRVNISWTRLEYIGYDITYNASGYSVKINNSATGGTNVSFGSS